MRLATLRLGDGVTAAARVDGDRAVQVEPYPSVSALLRDPDWRSIAAAAVGAVVDLTEVDHAPVVPDPRKIVCVGLNYANHIAEMGRELPEFPTLFAKFPDALVGPYDNITVPSWAGTALDWEGELALIVGAPAAAVPVERAEDYIAGYTVANDVTVRDFQYRTTQWLQGKTFAGTCPLGPTLVTPDEFRPGPQLTTSVDDTLVQSAATGDLVFGPQQLIAYISHIVPLHPGDVILTGTPGGVGHPSATYLRDGHTLRTAIDGLGAQCNTVRIHESATAI